MILSKIIKIPVNTEVIRCYTSLFSGYSSLDYGIITSLRRIYDPRTSLRGSFETLFCLSKTLHLGRDDVENPDNISPLLLRARVGDRSRR